MITYKDTERAIENLKEGEEAIINGDFRYLFPMKDIKTEEITVDGFVALKIKKITNYKDYKISNGFEPSVPRKQYSLDEYQVRGLSKWDFI